MELRQPVNSENQKTDQDFIVSPSKLTAVNLHYLLEYTKSPCSIFIHHQGKFIGFIKKNEEIRFSVLQKIKTEFNSLGFVLLTELNSWQEWEKQRYIHIQIQGQKQNQKNSKLNANDVDSSTKKRRRDFYKYATSKIIFNPKNREEKEAAEKAGKVLNDAINSRLLDWYFSNADNENQPLIAHCCRVTYLALLFASIQIKNKPTNDLSLVLIALSSIIHELEGDPSKVLAENCHSARTLEILSQKGNLIPKQIY